VNRFLLLVTRVTFLHWHFKYVWQCQSWSKNTLRVNYHTYIFVLFVLLTRLEYSASCILPCYSEQSTTAVFLTCRPSNMSKADKQCVYLHWGDQSSTCSQKTWRSSRYAVVVALFRKMSGVAEQRVPESAVYVYQAKNHGGSALHRGFVGVKSVYAVSPSDLFSDGLTHSRSMAAVKTTNIQPYFRLSACFSSLNLHEPLCSVYLHASLWWEQISKDVSSLFLRNVFDSFLTKSLTCFSTLKGIVAKHPQSCLPYHTKQMLTSTVVGTWDRANCQGQRRWAMFT
jgi:hypothetical protein